MYNKNYDFVVDQDIFAKIYYDSQTKFHAKNRHYRREDREDAFSEFWANPRNFFRIVSYMKNGLNIKLLGDDLCKMIDNTNIS